MSAAAATAGRRAVTLVECLVLISIIGLLAAFLLPAVQAGREAARRAQCLNNLHQVSLALHTYTSDHGSFPPCHNSNDYSVHVALLPYLEMKPLYDSFNFQFAAAYPPLENQTACVASVSILLCPSDIKKPADGTPSWTNYVGNLGGGVQRYGYNGAFGAPYMSLRPSEFTDGLGTTAMMSEIVLGGGGAEERNFRRALFHAPPFEAPEQLDEFASACRSINPKMAPINPHFKGWNWSWGEFSHTFYNHVLPPNQPSCVNGNGFQTGAFTAGSQHSGGVNVLFGDGHTKFVKDGVDTALWRALASRNGSELVNDSP